MNNILEAYKKLEETREHGEERVRKDAETMAAFQESQYWRVLRDVIERRIAGLYTLADDVGAVLEGEMSEEEFGRVALRARFAAAHLQDIIKLVEENHRWYAEEAQRMKEKEGKK